MKTARRPRIRSAVAGAAAAILTLLPIAAGPARAAPAQAAQTPAVQLRVLDVSPSSPSIDSVARLTVTLQVTNKGTSTTGTLRVDGLRGDPLTSISQLHTTVAHPPSTPSGQPIKPKTPVTLDLTAGETATVRFQTTTGVPRDSGICLCARGVYPLEFSVRPDADDSAEEDKPLATAVTYLPSFYERPPQQTSVSWVWPLIDHPHRLLDNGADARQDNVFTDDDLASQVATSGRLARALDTVVQLESTGEFPITLLIDPELLDELSTMQSGYRVGSGTHTVAGTGTDAASAWLDQLRTLVQTDPAVDVQLTPYADPDVQSLHVDGLSWSTALPAQMREHVTQALGGRALRSTVAWPPSNAVGSGTLGVLADQGVRTVVVDAAAVTPRDGANNNVPTGVARLSRHSHTIAAALTDATAQHYAADVVSLTTTNGSAAPGLAELPQLVAQVAMRTAQAPTDDHTLVITPPRYVDPNPAVAARAIRATSATPFARPVALSTVTAPAALPHKHSRPASAPDRAGLPSTVLDTASRVHALIPKINSLIGGAGRGATQLLAGLPLALQRSESAGWVHDVAGGTGYARALDHTTSSLANGVDIVRPASGSYTLASSTSPLPVAVRNTLPYRVRIQLHVTTVNAAPGFTVKAVGTQIIAPNDQRTIRLPARIDRSGRIRLHVQLTTAGNQNLGPAIPLSVHSTALGFVGVIITIVAGAVLALALLLRLFRRLRARRRKQVAKTLAAVPAAATASDGAS